MKRIDLSREEINTILSDLKEENNGNRDKSTMLDLANKLLQTIETDLWAVYTMQMDEEVKAVFRFSCLYDGQKYYIVDGEDKIRVHDKDWIDLTFSGTYLNIQTQVNKLLEANKGIVATLQKMR